MNRRLRMIALLLATHLAACDSGHEHDEADHAHEEEDHGHGHGHGHEGASEAVTVWGEHTQLFVEFPALVAGEDSPFAAHLTRLSDHLAIPEGRAEVTLACDGQPPQQFVVDAPSVAGIFRPVVHPTQAGRCRVSLALTSASATESHEVGTFTVFASRAAADAAASDEDEDPSEIGYLLEQQWKVPFRIAKVEARSVRPSFPAFARLQEPPDAEAVVTAPRDGRVMATKTGFPTIGADFEEGDVMIRLSTAPPEGADPASLDLAIDEASIRVGAATREIERITPLVDAGVVPQRNLDAANSALASAKAELRSAQRRRRSLRQAGKVGGRADALDVPAPIRGALAELHVSPGTWVTEGDRLARVVDRDRLMLEVGVPEAWVGRVREVSGAWFALEEVLGVPAESLVSIGTEIDEATRTLPVLFRVDNADHALFAGLTTQAHLIYDTPHTAVAVETTAVLDEDGVSVVYVQTGGESFERRSVRLGIHDGAYVEVTEGLAVGEWVVARGAYGVKLAATSTASIGHGHAH